MKRERVLRCWCLPDINDSVTMMAKAPSAIVVLQGGIDFVGLPAFSISFGTGGCEVGSDLRLDR